MLKLMLKLGFANMFLRGGRVWVKDRNILKFYEAQLSLKQRLVAL